MKLYIIGNGFDLYHRLPSSYLNFKAFVKENDTILYEKIDRYLDYNGNFWYAFEDNLRNINEEYLIDDAMQYYTPFRVGDWSEWNHENYESILELSTIHLNSNLKSNLAKWALQLNKSPLSIRHLDLLRDSLFVTFNYTNTLERHYNIEENRILYIHGKVYDENSELIYGHSLSKSEAEFDFEPVQEELDKEEKSGQFYRSIGEDNRIEKGIDIIKLFYHNTRKPIEKVIKKNELLFNKLDNINEVIIIGHSLSKVDIPYIEAIAKKVKPNSKWIVYYYNSNDIPYHLKVLNSIGIPTENISNLDIDPSRPIQTSFI